MLPALLVMVACVPEPRRQYKPSGPATSGPATGVIRPPVGVDPGIHTTVPVPNPNTTPVIPPDPRLDAR